MSDYNFSHGERYAIFTVHRERCWLCDEPLFLSEMEVDHIIPESIEPPALKSAVLEFGLPAAFSVNSFENWMPAHRKCNQLKRGSVFRPSPLIQNRLEVAAQRATRARDLLSAYITKGNIDKALQQLLVAKENDQLTEDHREGLISLVGQFHEGNRANEARGTPFLLAPWLTNVGEDDRFLFLRGPGGMVGARPKGDNLHISWDCPNCGITAWNGVRCVACGMMDDGD